MAKALKMASVGPVMVTIRSGQFPSEMLIRAPLYVKVEKKSLMSWDILEFTGILAKFYLRLHAFSSLFLLSGNNKKKNIERLFLAGCFKRVAKETNTFPMMLPTSCRNMKPLLAFRVLCLVKTSCVRHFCLFVCLFVLPCRASAVGW